MAKITDQMTYIVIAGGIVMERRTDELDRKSVVRDIADAQYDDLEQVLECNPVEGTCRDVTEDICNEICESWADEGLRLKDWQYDFVEFTRGTVAANAFYRSPRT